MFPHGPHGLQERMCSIFCWRSKISFEIWLIPSHPQSPSGRIIFGCGLLTDARNGKGRLVMSLGPSFGPPEVGRSGSRSRRLPGSTRIIFWWGKRRVHPRSIWGSDPGETLLLVVGFGLMGICENWWGGVKISWVTFPHVLRIYFPPTPCFPESRQRSGSVHGLAGEDARADTHPAPPQPHPCATLGRPPHSSVTCLAPGSVDNNRSYFTGLCWD